MKEVARIYALADLMELLKGTATRSTREELEEAVGQAAKKFVDLMGKRRGLKLLQEIPGAFKDVAEDARAMELLDVATRAVSKS